MMMKVQNAGEGIYKKESVQDVQTVCFPVNVMPEFYHNLIEDCSNSLGFEKSYCATSILSVVSTCIGNAINVKVKNGWSEPVILYCAMYGDSSKKKTPVINMFLKPFYQMETEYQNDYEDQLKDWEQFEDKPAKPQRKHIIINDATPESIIQVHSNNKKSLIYLNDELISMVKRFNQYRNGPDSEFWLSQWSNTPIKITRKSQDTIYFQNPFISILGGIQPNIVKELGKDGRDENGFVYRILFTLPENNEADQWSDREADPKVLEEYNRIIQTLHNSFNETYSDNEAIEVKFSDDAKKVFINWFNQNASLIHDADDDYLKSIYKKLEAYYIRFSLILEVMQCTQTGEEVESISKASALGALKLTEYFRHTSGIIYEKIREEGFQSDIDKKIYDQLPAEFTTSDIIEIAELHGIQGNTVKKRLIPRFKDKGYIRKVRHGQYSKGGVHDVHDVHDQNGHSVQNGQVSKHDEQSRKLHKKDYKDLPENLQKNIDEILGPNKI